MSTVRQTARRILALVTAAVALTAVVAAAPASADPDFGAGNLPRMEVTEGATLNYAVSLPACADGYRCRLSTYLTGGIATRGRDFRGVPVTRVFTSTSGPIVGVQPIHTFDDQLVEGDEALFVNARVFYFRDGVSAPESSFLWKGIVTIHDKKPLAGTDLHTGVIPVGKVNP